MKGGNELVHSEQDGVQGNDMNTKMLAPYDMKGGKSKKVTGKKTVKRSSRKVSGKKSKSMKGGMESSGATPMDQRFYNADLKYDNYPSNSGNGVMSAYGPIEAGNVGTGMLAPFTASTSSSANPNTMMKTGGKKKLKSKKGGDGIPYISDSGVTRVQNALDSAVDGFSGFMRELDSDYINSVNHLKNMKIGNQRLIQGGKKNGNNNNGKKIGNNNSGNNNSGKKSGNNNSGNNNNGKKIGNNNSGNNNSGKKSGNNNNGNNNYEKLKKLGGKKNKKYLKGGFDGSDWATTLASRGPANAPDDYWGVPGEKWFRQFNKTGEYIPNSQLAYAATPELAGKNDSGIVTGYDESIINNGVSNNF